MQRRQLSFESALGQVNCMPHLLPTLCPCLLLQLYSAGFLFNADMLLKYEMLPVSDASSFLQFLESLI